MAHAYATMKIRVSCDSNWSGSTTIDQVSQQAEEDARKKVAKAFNGTAIKVIGDVEITAVHTNISPDTP